MPDVNSNSPPSQSLIIHPHTSHPSQSQSRRSDLGSYRYDADADVDASSGILVKERRCIHIKKAYRRMHHFHLSSWMVLLLAVFVQKLTQGRRLQNPSSAAFISAMSRRSSSVRRSSSYGACNIPHLGCTR